MKGIHKSAWLLAIGSGLLQILIFPRPNLYWLCWIALAPLFYALLRAREADATELLNEESDSFLVPARAWQGFLLGWASGTVFYFGTCYWVYSVMHLYGGLSPFISFLLLVLFSMYIGLHHAIFGMLMAVAGRSRVGFSRKALVLAPFLWVAVELLRAYVVSFPWTLLGTAQVDNLPLARLASVTGVYGVSFEIALVNTVFAAAMLVNRKRRIATLGAALAGAIALQSTVLVKVEASPVDAHATLVQQNVPIERQWTFEGYDQLLKELGSISRAPEAGRNSSVAPLIVWPESPAPFETDDRLFSESTAALARRQQSWLLAGATAVVPVAPGSAPKTSITPRESEQVYNSALLLNPAGTVVQRYDKVHLVPWGEYVPFSWAFGFAKALTHEVGAFSASASGRTPLEVGSHRYGTFICYESVFPHEVRQFAEHGAEVFVNISNDGWFGDSGAPWQHLNMARMRAVENHRWLLRSTNTGITSAIDPLGRVVAVAPRNRRVVLDAPYGVISETTFYTRYGDWFPVLCAIISITGLLWRDRTGAHMTHPVPV
ncbi:MAG TPA: apolipoprotein N-acyltransferase [Candidatus Saccharimonadales bacterium]|nr:apolipoprotein N-acyltransferase [Candidatus Saccharimonadales bacterium]